MQKRRIYNRIPLFWGEDMDWRGSRKRSAKRKANRWRRNKSKALVKLLWKVEYEG